MPLIIRREMEVYRQKHPMTEWRGDRQNGVFYIPARGLYIIASNGGGWDHISVSLKDRCPVWDEMEFARRQFFEDTDTVIQIHPPLNDYVNCMPYCLHLWRPQEVVIPLPSKDMIA